MTLFFGKKDSVRIKKKYDMLITVTICVWILISTQSNLAYIESFQLIPLEA